MESSPVRRGEIRRVDLEPARGEEANKRRPAVIVSNEGANRRAALLGRGLLQVVPLTTNIVHVEPFHVLIPASESGLRADSKAQAEQIRAVAVEQIGELLGRVPPDLMLEIGDALRIQLVL
jgi:mRNA interferase MazF